MADNQVIPHYNPHMNPPSIKLERKKKMQEFRENESFIKNTQTQEGYKAPKCAKQLNYSN